MGSMSTGEMFTQEQYEEMPLRQREELQIVSLTPEESKHLEGMNRKERRNWMRANKKFSRRTRDVKVA